MPTSSNFTFQTQNFFANKKMSALLVTVFLATFVLVTFARAIPEASAATTQEPPSQQIDTYHIHVVEHGESFWSIASALAPGKDPRPIMEQLIEKNGYASLQVGQKIFLPTKT